MPLILAIDSDRRQSEQLALLMRRLRVHLIQATSAGEGLRALQDRIPDLILTSPLLSPFDEGVLDEYLRELGPEGAHVQTLRIPVLSAASKPSTGSLFGLGRNQASVAGPDGGDPDLFADEISEYLARAEERKLSASSETASFETPSSETDSFTTAPFETTSIEPVPIMSTNPFIGAGTINRRSAAPIKREKPVVARDANEASEDHEPIVAPAPVFVEPQRRVVEPPATRAAAARVETPKVNTPPAPVERPAPRPSHAAFEAFAASASRAQVEPPAASTSRARVERPASGQTTVTPEAITSFGTAFAAIRAAWVAQGLATMAANTAKADESPIVTREIVKAAAPAESGPGAMTPPTAQTVSAPVDKPGEVADRDAQPAPATTKVRIISVG